MYPKKRGIFYPITHKHRHNTHTPTCTHRHTQTNTLQTWRLGPLMPTVCSRVNEAEGDDLRQSSSDSCQTSVRSRVSNSETVSPLRCAANHHKTASTRTYVESRRETNIKQGMHLAYRERIALKAARACASWLRAICIAVVAEHLHRLS